jgi:hypothetical protein
MNKWKLLDLLDPSALHDRRPHCLGKYTVTSATHETLINHSDAIWLIIKLQAHTTRHALQQHSNNAISTTTKTKTTKTCFVCPKRPGLERMDDICEEAIRGSNQHLSSNTIQEAAILKRASFSTVSLCFQLPHTL